MAIEGDDSTHGRADEDSPVAESAGEDDSEDCYMDGPYLVFTKAYHLKRGYCCQSGCRHCPYGFGTPDAPDSAGLA